MRLSLFCPPRGPRADPGEFDILTCLKSKSPPLSLLGASNALGVGERVRVKSLGIYYSLNTH